MPVHYSPATLGLGARFTIESVAVGQNVSHVVATTLGDHFTPAGVKAALGAANTYIAALSAGNLLSLATTADPTVSVSPGRVVISCLPADTATLAATLAGVLSTAANTAAG